MTWKTTSLPSAVICTPVAAPQPLPVAMAAFLPVLSVLPTTVATPLKTCSGTPPFGTPLPQPAEPTGAGTVDCRQLAAQKSPASLLASSHCSGATTAPSPQTAVVLSARFRR